MLNINKVRTVYKALNGGWINQLLNGFNFASSDQVSPKNLEFFKNSSAFLKSAETIANEDVINGENYNKIMGGVNLVTKVLPEPYRSIVNNVTGLTGVINGLNAKDSQKINFDLNDIASVLGSYSGSYQEMLRAKQKEGKYGLFNRKERNKANSIINDANATANLLNKINLENELYTHINPQALLNYRNKIDGISFVKKGGLIDRVQKIDFKNNNNKPITIATINPPEKPFIPDLSVLEQFKKGGKIEEKESPEIETTLQNVIPEGALHKNKHHMENSEGLTQKGIPVIDNNGEQLAEIECNEIILTLELTKKMEEMKNQYFSEDLSLSKKDIIAMEAGGILVDLILNNTDDRTGLINSITDGETN